MVLLEQAVLLAAYYLNKTFGTLTLNFMSFIKLIPWLLGFTPTNSNI
jgi:hypothetical protein